MNYHFDFNSVFRNMQPLWDGLGVTLQLTLAANAIGLTFGFIVALFLFNKYALLRMPFIAFVEFYRCTPAMVQIVWFFYCVPMMFNWFLPPVTMGIIALSLNLVAFNAEAYRSAIQNVPREHIDAGIALGFTPFQRIRYIILPTAFRSSLPVLLTNGIVIFQQSALVALVAVNDLMYAGKSLATNNFRPIETFTIVALIYFAISYPVSQFVGWMEKRREIMSS